MKLRNRFVLPLCKLCLSVTATGPVAAQATAALPITTAFSAWKTSDEITVTGTILEVLQSSAPAGVNLRLEGTGTACANLGSRLSGSPMLQALQIGSTTRVTGTVRQIGGGNCILARELVLMIQGSAAQTFKLRNANGFPVRTVTAPGSRPRQAGASQGGAQ